MTSDLCIQGRGQLVVGRYQQRRFAISEYTEWVENISCDLKQDDASQKVCGGKLQVRFQ